MTVQVTAAMVKELRERTGVGMNKCKEALVESEGNMEEAVAFLRKAGIASAVKKEGREANEGLVVSAENNSHVVLLELSAETDFVVKNDNFQNFANTIAKQALAESVQNVEALSQLPFANDQQQTVEEFRTSLVQSLGENIQIKKLAKFVKSGNNTIAVYSHMGGKIVSLVEISGSDAEDVLAKDIAMHTAAEAPEYLNESEVPSEVLEKEKDIAKTQALSSGKPENIVDKIVEGKIKSFYDQVCLLRQKYIKDSNLTISQLVEAKAKEAGKALEINSYLRWKAGA